MTASFDLMTLLAIGSPLVSLIVLLVGLRFHAKHAVQKDNEHDARIDTLEKEHTSMRVQVATLTERTDGIRTHIDERFDRMERQVSEIFKRLNQ